MKYVPLIAATGLAIVLCIQNGIIAGGNPPPRSVPVIVQDVMPPSRMVAVSLHGTGPREQIPISLQPDTVFVLTSWTAIAGSGTPWVLLYEGNSGSVESYRDLFVASTEVRTLHHAFPTGIRFPRDTSGMADIYQSMAGGGAATITLQGYITDDF